MVCQNSSSLEIALHLAISRMPFPVFLIYNNCISMLYCFMISLLFCFALMHTHPFNSPFSWTTRVSRYQKGKTNLDFTEARDSEWQWHHLGHMQVCTRSQITMQAPHHSFLQAGCPSCRPTNSVKALKANMQTS